MHLPTIRARRRVQRQLEALPAHPRQAALEWLKDSVAAGRAGLDPYDESVFIVQAADGERVWAYIALEVCGTILSYVDQAGGERRLRAILEADVRVALRLDEEDPPLMLDEPLASRAVALSAAERLVAADRLLNLVTDAVRPRPLDDPEAPAAIARAKAAYDRREAENGSVA